MKEDKNESRWDKLLNIRTMGRDDTHADQYRYPYEPTPYSVPERLANAGYIRKGNILLDYGCGKGRVDFFLSYQTRCKSIGIEYDERIYEKAAENKKDAVSSGRVEIELANAEEFAVPETADCMYYAIEDYEEAKAYIENAVTNAHLRESSEALLQLESDDATRVMGWPDDLKLRSSMTLFALAAKENEVFRRVLDKFFDGKLDAQTVDILDMRYLVMRIDEPDFGCEGRPDGVEPMAKVTLLKLKSEEEIQLEIPDAELYQKEINEGNEVAFSPDGVILKLS